MKYIKTLAVIFLIFAAASLMVVSLFDSAPLDIELGILLALVITYCVNEDNKGEEK